MADRIFTSTAGEETLNALRHATKVEYASLARLALCYSLRGLGAAPPRSTDGGGKEIRLVSLFGGDELVIKNTIALIYGRQVQGDEPPAGLAPSVVKDHVDNGLAMIGQRFQGCAQDDNILLQRLAAEVQLDVARLRTGAIPNIDVVVGTKDLSSERVVIELNNTARHANSHLAIMGKPGVGKTQLLLKMLADIRVQSRFRTNFIFFDYKGDVSDKERFIDVTRATVYQIPHQQLPVNPFVLEDYAENSILISAREKAESFASINAHFGTVQKGSLTTAVQRAYGLRSSQPVKYPDFREVFAIVQEMYTEEGRRDDSLMEILRDLASFRLFWEHSSADGLIERISDRTMVIDLHQLPVLKELVAYLVIERLYKEMASLPDSQTKDGRRDLRTILVIDEAHNYLPQRNPFLQKIVREGRSKGIVVFFASQSPNDYTQESFDFKELLEFCFMFQCEGVSANAVQKLLGCSTRTAKELQVELARLRPFQVASKSLSEGEEFTQFRAEAFHRAYQ
jgi:DNA sulfur modification protein DndE